MKGYLPIPGGWVPVDPEPPNIQDGRLDVDWGGTPPPRWGTKADPLAQCLLADYEFLAALLGLKLMGWQRLALGTGSEMDRWGRPTFRTVEISDPRRSGKSIVLLLRVLWQLLLAPPMERRAIWSAQSLSDAVGLWEGELVPMLKATEMWDRFDMKLRRSLNNAGFYTMETGGFMRILGSSAGGGHGSGNPLIIYDELWQYLDDRRQQALTPTMRTFPNAQSWGVSTVGDAEHGQYWHPRMERNRKLVDDGKDRASRLCYLEWSAPAKSDESDPVVWVKSNPAAGRTVSLEVLADDYADHPGPPFRRGVLNMLPAVSGEDLVFPPGVFDPILRSGLMLGESAKRRADAGSVSSLWIGVDGMPWENLAAVSWSDGEAVDLLAVTTRQKAAALVHSLIAAHPIAGVVAMRGGPMEFEAQKIEAILAAAPGAPAFVWIGRRADRAAVCSGYRAAVTSGKLLVGSDPAWLAAAKGAIKKEIGRPEAVGWIWVAGDKSARLFSLWSMALSWFASTREAWAPKPDLVFMAPRDDDETYAEWLEEYRQSIGG